MYSGLAPQVISCDATESVGYELGVPIPQHWWRQADDILVAEYRELMVADGASNAFV